MDFQSPSVRKIVRDLYVDGYSLHDLDSQVGDRLDHLVTLALNFFRSPIDQKRARVWPDECGYRAFGSEYSDAPDRPDQMESYTVSGRMISPTFDVGIQDALDRAALRVFEDLEEIALSVVRALAGTLGEDSIGAVPDSALRRWSRLQLNYSRPGNTQAGLIHEPHEDRCLLTVAGATGPGLQIFGPNGSAMSVTTGSRQLVVMTGGIAAMMTGGTIRPTYHRVVPVPELRERIAFLLFADLSPGLCRPWLATPLNHQVDIGRLVRSNVKNFGLAGFDGD